MPEEQKPARENTQAWTGLVKGRVQRVFFRAETRQKALQYGINGWVRNTLEGHGEVLICGDPDAIDRMRKWLAEGPPRARVDGLELAQCPDPGLSGFEIRK